VPAHCAHAFLARALARCVSLTRFRCSQSLDKIEMVTLPSGLQYRDIVVGSGPNPQPGYQARARRLATAPHARPVPMPTARARAACSSSPLASRRAAHAGGG
jgi:hypothetical protein